MTGLQQFTVYRYTLWSERPEGAFGDGLLLFSVSALIFTDGVSQLCTSAAVVLLRCWVGHLTVGTRALCWLQTY